MKKIQISDMTLCVRNANLSFKEKIEIAASKSVKFKASKALKDAVK